MGDGFVKVIRWFEEKNGNMRNREEGRGWNRMGRENEYKKMCVESSPVSILLLFIYLFILIYTF